MRDGKKGGEPRKSSLFLALHPPGPNRKEVKWSVPHVITWSTITWPPLPNTGPQNGPVLFCSTGRMLISPGNLTFSGCFCRAFFSLSFSLSQFLLVNSTTRGRNFTFFFLLTTVTHRGRYICFLTQNLRTHKRQMIPEYLLIGLPGNRETHAHLSKAQAQGCSFWQPGHTVSPEELLPCFCCL